MIAAQQTPTYITHKYHGELVERRVWKQPMQWIDYFGIYVLQAIMPY